MTITPVQLVEEWLLKLPLYSPIPLNSRNHNAAREIHLYTGSFDAYCPECGKLATFRAQFTEFAKENYRHYTNGIHVTWPTEFIRKDAECTRNHHKLIYIFAIHNDTLIKIGQLPSLADIALEETSEFKSVFSKSQLQELNKGIGLAAHGVGVGSFVYLRRIFESLIEEAHQLAIQDIGWNDTEYLQSRMKERITMLAHHLPEFIVSNTTLYGLLSKGIHELTEEECLDSFDKIKAAILVIAEEKLTELKRQKRVQEASKYLSS